LRTSGSVLEAPRAPSKPVHNLVRHLQAQQRLATHQSEHAASLVMQTMNRSSHQSSVIPLTLLLKGQQNQQSILHFVRHKQICGDRMKPGITPERIYGINQPRAFRMMSSFVH
jgi:hypothetical protein